MSFSEGRSLFFSRALRRLCLCRSGFNRRIIFVCVDAVSTAELSLHFPAITFAPNTSSTLWVDRMNFPSGLLKIEVKC